MATRAGKRTSASARKGPSRAPPGLQQAEAPPARVHEPVWLVRIVLVLFLAGFAAFLAREVSNFLRVLP